MAAIINILGMVLFLGLIAQGNGECSLSDLSVTQSKTGAKVQNKTEWSVSITNKCSCVQLNVLLNCKGFQTVENIDPSVFSVVSGDVCLVQNGQPIYTKPFNFKYAWDNSFLLTPNSSEIACS